MKNRTLLETLAAAWLAASPAAAQQLVVWPIGKPSPFPIILQPPRPGPRPVPVPFPVRPLPLPPEDGTRLGITGYRVQGKIQDSAASLDTTIVFHNSSASRLEGVLVVPIPAGTVLSSFNMTAGGKTLKGELLEAGQASAIYESIVRQMRDPGLLELVGERMLRARVFPIEPHSDIVVRIGLSQVLHASGGITSLTLPLRSAQLTGAQAQGASVHLTLNARAPIRTLYSPLPGVKIQRQGDRGAVVTYESREASESDLDLFYSLARGPLAAGLTTFKEEDEDGTFMLSLAPRREAAAEGGKAASTPKDVVFIVDRSGSMEDNGKFKQAQAALSYCVGKLKPEDRFGIVDFATETSMFERGLQQATPGTRARALRYIARLEPSGGTNIEGALGDGLSLLDGKGGGMAMVFFLTDGLPTVGQTQMEELLRAAGAKNREPRARLFVFGVGNDVNTLFLDKLAQGNRGSQDYVRPNENIETKVSSLYQKVAEPALTDVQLAWKGVEVEQVVPRRVDDIFFGSELVLFGRYKAWGKGTLVVTGKAAGKPARFEYPVEFPERADANGFLPRLWASQKVAAELDAVRLAGRADPEVVESIVRLAKRYGIVTPYTSYLITEDGMDMGMARRRMEVQARSLSQDAFESGSRSAGGADQSARAQKASSFLSAMSGSAASVRGSAESAAPMAAVQGAMILDAEKEARSELHKKGIQAARTRTVAGKTFYLRGEEWVDGVLDGVKDALAKAVTVRYMSEDYFRLLQAEPGLGRYLSLGSRMALSYRGKTYRVVE